MFQSQFGRWSFLLSAVLLGWSGLALQLFLTLQSVDGESLKSAIVPYLLVFSVVPNLLATAALMLTLLAGPRFPSPGFMTGLAVGFLFYWLASEAVLVKWWAPLDPQWLANVILHFTMPIVLALFWTLFVPKGHLHWSAPFAWLLWPVCYFIFALVAGRLTGIYPHSLTDIAVLGRETVYASLSKLAMAFLLMGLVVAMLDKMLAPLTTQTQKKGRPDFSRAPQN